MFQKSIRNFFVITCVLCLSINSKAQTKYSSDPNYLQSKGNNFQLVTNSFQSDYPDTSIQFLHNYAARNFSGNLGLSQPNYFFKYYNDNLGFRYYESSLVNDQFKASEVKYYKTKGPFASLTGIAGSKQEQTFKLLFSHTTKKNLNMSLAFNRFGSLGFYNKQQTFTNNFYSSINYTSPNKRIGLYSYLLFNKNKHQENGGVKYDSIIQEEPLISKSLLEVKLSDAKRENRETQLNLNPWICLNHKTDSSSFSNYIDYKFIFKSNYYWYLDKGVGIDNFYDSTYLNSTLTHDSTHLNQYLNQINYSFRLNKIGLTAKIGYSYEYSQFFQRFGKDFSNHMLTSSLYYSKFKKVVDSSSNSFKKISTSINYSQVINGYNQNDYKIEWLGELKFKLTEFGTITKKSSIIQLSISSEQRHPDYFYSKLESNNFRWENNFKSINLFQGQIKLKHEYTGLSSTLLWQNFANYVYLDTTAYSKQTNVEMSKLAYSLEFNKILLKHLGIRASVTYQSTNQEFILRYAPTMLSGSLFYSGNLFKNNLQLQVGTQTEYYTNFKAYAYMPSYNLYFNQNRFNAGEYPFVDVFLNARIRPVQFFVKVENALHGLVGTNYSFVEGYYQPDRAFRFGLTWLFFD